MTSQPLYALPKQEVFNALETSPEGLPSEEVTSRRALYGGNTLSDPPAPSPLRRWVRYTTHPMALLLWAAGGAAFAIDKGEYTLGFTHRHHRD